MRNEISRSLYYPVVETIVWVHHANPQIFCFDKCCFVEKSTKSLELPSTVNTNHCCSRENSRPTRCSIFYPGECCTSK